MNGQHLLLADPAFVSYQVITSMGYGGCKVESGVGRQMILGGNSWNVFPCVLISSSGTRPASFQIPRRWNPPAQFRLLFFASSKHHWNTGQQPNEVFFRLVVPVTTRRAINSSIKPTILLCPGSLLYNPASPASKPQMMKKQLFLTCGSFKTACIKKTSSQEERALVKNKGIVIIL